MLQSEHGWFSDNLLDLRSIANCLSMDYSSGEIELATLSSMSKYDLAQYLTEKEESEQCH